jgi:hypothetical protein
MGDMIWSVVVVSCHIVVTNRQNLYWVIRIWLSYCRSWYRDTLKFASLSAGSGIILSIIRR